MPAEPSPRSVLLVEDNPADADILAREATDVMLLVDDHRVRNAARHR
jgi:hypothetical protein